MLSILMAESTTANAANSNSSFGGANTLVMMGLLLAFFYFMVIRPENKKKKEQEALRNSLRKGDKIITIGGIMGKIVDVKDDKIVIETGEDQVRMELQKWAVMTNGTAEKDKGKRGAGAKKAGEDK